jgi:radical SAM protein with 4Fe4S-binding SPASM domain
MYNKKLVSDLKKRNLTVYEEVYEIRMGVSMKCTRDCTFCGISRKPTEDMTIKTLQNILDSATDRLRKVCLSVYGESIMHPNIVEFIDKMKTKFPKLQISTITNTDYFRKKGIKLLLEMYDLGLNYTIADLYDDAQEEWFLNSLRKNYTKFVEKNIEIVDFYVDSENIWSYHGPHRKKLFVVRDKNGPGTGGKVATRVFHTYGGNLDISQWPEKIKALDFPLKKVCAEPLKYLTITADGGVYMCCRDGGLTGEIGNVNQQGINEIWQGDKMQIARKVLIEGHRDLISPCVLCNARTFRTGIYPYWGHKDYNTEEIKKVLLNLSKLNKEETLYKNLMYYKNEKGWKPSLILKEALNNAK